MAALGTCPFLWLRESPNHGQVEGSLKSKQSIMVKGHVSKPRIRLRFKIEVTVGNIESLPGSTIRE